MSFVGKILVATQVVLSVLFMAVAGAVFSAHTNWRTKAETAQTNLTKAQSDSRAALDNAENEKSALTAQFEDEKQKRLKAESDLANMQTNLAALVKDKNDLQAQLQTQTGIAETKSSEAGYRGEEARNQRIINSDLQARLDATVRDIRVRNDELFALQGEMKDLQRQHDELLAANQFLTKVVAQKGLTTDPREAAKLQAPPPTVDGVVSEVKADRTGRPNMILITIGSDDGLVKGHELDAFRSGVDGRKPQYLGRVRVLSTTQNTAVCEVINTAKNGIIEVGDNVTTKLL